MKTKFILIFSFSLYFLFHGQSGFSQLNSGYAQLNKFLKFHELSSSLPNGYSFVDTSLLKKYFRIFKLSYVNKFQIKSSNGNVMIFIISFPYSKSDEDKLKRLYPNSEIDLRKEYLSVIRNLISGNNSQFTDSISFNEKDINFYSKRKLKKLAADMIGDYTIRLVSPYEGEYNYISFRFMGKYYKSWIYSFIFYKEYNPETAKKILKETLFLFKYNN